LERHLPAIRLQAHGVGDEPRGRLALIAVGVAALDRIPRQAVEGEEQPIRNPMRFAGPSDRVGHGGEPSSPQIRA